MIKMVIVKMMKAASNLFSPFQAHRRNSASIILRVLARKNCHLLSKPGSLKSCVISNLKQSHVKQARTQTKQSQNPGVAELLESFEEEGQGGSRRQPSARIGGASVIAQSRFNE